MRTDRVALVDVDEMRGEEEIGDVTAVEIEFVGLDDEGLGACQMLVEEVLGGAAFFASGFGGVDFGQADAAAGPRLKAEIDVEIEGVGVDQAGVLRLVDVSDRAGALERRLGDFAGRDSFPGRIRLRNGSC